MCVCYVTHTYTAQLVSLYVHVVKLVSSYVMVVYMGRIQWQPFAIFTRTSGRRCFTSFRESRVMASALSSGLAFSF